MLRSGRRSGNIDDRRGRRALGMGAGLGGGGLVVVLLVVLLGGDLSSLFQGSGGDAPRSEEETALADFVAIVLADTEDTWNPLFQGMGRQYVEPTLVLFTDSVDSACGTASSAVGPFYCPGDQQVYLDLGFFAELHNRFGAAGDFAQAYVIAHEVGHHVQTLLGITSRVDGMSRGASQDRVNALSVQVELQADCFAGVWAYHADRTRHVVQSGDIEEALEAAGAIGDDALQRQAQGYVVPESFTHGTSAQRIQWFRTGYQSGQMESCNTGIPVL